MFTHQSAILFWAVLAALPLMTSVIYFLASPIVTPLAQRVATSAHGVVIALLHLGTVYIAAEQLHGDQYGMPFFFLCLVAAALVGYSFLAFQGNRQVHWLQAINILWLFGLLSLGGMAITGRWL